MYVVCTVLLVKFKGFAPCTRGLLATTGENKAILSAAVKEVPINFGYSKKLSVRVMLL